MIDTIIKQIKEVVPVRYRVYRSKPPIPFAVYYEDMTENFAADNIVYLERTDYILELYTEKKNHEIESKIEQIFAANDTPWEKEESYIEQERLIMTAYYFTL